MKTSSQTRFSPFSGPLPRRDFLKRVSGATAALAATAALKPRVFGQAPSVNVAGANNRLVVGYIGLGQQGFHAHVRLMHQFAQANNIAQAAVCDVWSKRVDEAKGFVGGDCAGFARYEELLARKDIDAVVIATHDPLHAKPTLDALQAGKHVYVEKPMTRYLGEAFEIHDAVKAGKLCFQLGSQGCTAAGWHKSAELIREGVIGTPVWGQGYYCRNNPTGEWNYTIDASATAESMDWKGWLGPVNKPVAFSGEHYFRWRKYYPFCAGLLGDLVPHRLLPLMLATGNPEFPRRVVCVGAHNVDTDAVGSAPRRDVPTHVNLLVEFPSGLILTVAASMVNARSPGFAIYGHRATLEIGTSGEAVRLIPEKPFADEVDPEEFTGLTPIEGIPEHHANWFDSIRNGKPANASVDLAVRSQVVISLAEISDRLNVACLFDEKTRKVTTQDGRDVTPLTYGLEA
ncbi:MAG: Gfo/Idh/MocA family oxidoreductase [Verrucomicrobia bacterium]|jgi:predicted dehydrogenase|nr:Gfo/Idh/MocA family oxidoreductase [Verrucomicrobiota bacterium]